MIETFDFNGLPAVRLQAPDGAQATVLLQGGQVLSWQAARGGEQLYLSPDARFSAGQAVRGGVPVVFPQFEQRGPDRSLPRHGFARTQPWQLDSERQSSAHAQATFALSDNEATRAMWNHGFLLELTVSIGGPELELELFVQNTGTTAWPFAAALHTYLAIAELDKVRLTGLAGLRYLDAARGDQEEVEDRPELRVYGEMDRIYRRAGALSLREGDRQLLISHENLPDAVIWNPGASKAAQLPDFPAQGWRQMLCVEAARISQPKTLAPGEEWAGRQSLRLGA